MKFVRLTLIIVFILFILSPFLLLPRFIKITNVSCISQYGPCDQELQNKLAKLSGLSLKETNLKIREIINENALIEEYLAQYKFPQAVAVNVITTKPLYALKNPGEDNVILVNSGGLAIYESGSSNLPTLIVPFSLPAPGEMVGEQILFALNVVYDMNSAYQVDRGEIANDYLSVNLSGGQTVRFPLKGDREVLLGSLSLILSRLNTDGEEFRIEEIQEVKVIDLRFKNPTLK